MVAESYRVCGQLLRFPEGAKSNSRNLVRCKLGYGWCTKLQGCLHAARLDTSGTGRKFAYQPTGNLCSQGQFGHGHAQGQGQVAPGQYHSVQLHTPPGGHKESCSMQGSLSVMGGGPSQEYHGPHPTLVVHNRQCRSRLSHPTQTESVGIPVDQGAVQADSGHLPTLSNLGCICIQSNSSAPQVHDMVPGQVSCGQRCSTSCLGPGHLSLPTCSPSLESAPKSQGSEDQGSVGVPTVAYSSVVANGAGHDGRTIHSAAISQRSLGARRGRSGSALHGTSRGCSPFGQSFGVSHSSSDLDQEDLAFLSHHLSPGTKAGYGYAFQQFGNFCATLGVNSHTCGPSILVKYIRKMYNEGAQYSTVNHHRCSISKLHLGFNGVSIGCHPLVSQAVKAVFRQRPPLPKYVATFDINRVFTFIKTLPPNSELSLKLLTFKTLFLLTASSISRVSSIQRLGPDVQFFEVSLIKVHCAI